MHISEQMIANIFKDEDLVHLTIDEEFFDRLNIKLFEMFFFVDEIGKKASWLTVRTWNQDGFAATGPIMGSTAQIAKTTRTNLLKERTIPFSTCEVGTVP